MSPSQPALREAALTAVAGCVAVLFGLAFLLYDPNFYFIDDTQDFQLPAYCEVARAWRDGEFPLLSRCSWRAGALAAEYQYGVFSAFLTPLILLVFSLGLSLPLTAAVLSLVHLAVLAAGAFRLARSRGLTVDLAMLVALLATLNGWIFIWGATAWLPGLFSFAWLPWMWWAMERSLRPGASWTAFVPAGLFLYLIVTAGWPFTVLMIGVVTAWLALRTWCERRAWAVWPLAASGLVGLGLSAPAWMMLLEYTPHTVRPALQNWLVVLYWMVPIEGLLGLVFPGYQTFWSVFENWKPHFAVELTGGLAPVAILAASLWRGGRAVLRTAPWEWGLFAFLLLLITAPSVGKFQYSFRWLPLFFLVLGLMSAHALAWLRSRETGSFSLLRAGSWACLLVVFVWLRGLLVGLDPTRTALLLGLAFIAITFAWAEVDRRCRAGSLLPAWAPCAVTLLTCAVTYIAFPPFREVPTWPFTERVRRAEPLDPAVRYLSVGLRDDVFALAPPDAATHRIHGVGVELYPGNSPMYAGFDFVNGYSPMMVAGLEQVFMFRNHGYFCERGADYVLGVETGRGGLLELVAVDGLLVSDRLQHHHNTLLANGWREVALVEGGRLYHRTGPASPRVRAVEHVCVVTTDKDGLDLLDRKPGTPAPVFLRRPTHGEEERFAPAQVTPIAQRRNSVEVDVTALSSSGDVLVLFARPWFPGYRAWCDGREVPVEVANLIMPAVRLPAGTSGRVVLEYRPPSLVCGTVAAAVTAGIVVLVLLVGWIRRNAWRR